MIEPYPLQEFDKVNYYHCPDNDCVLFWNPTSRCHCDGHCPHGDKMKIVIICHHCKAEIDLGHQHCKLQRVDCECGACNFHRMSGKSQLVRKDYEQPPFEELMKKFPEEWQEIYGSAERGRDGEFKIST